MTTLVSAIEVEFTPAATPFNIQVTGGRVSLLRKQTAGAPWSQVVSAWNGAAIVDNPVAGAVYKFSDPAGTVTVQADQ